MQSSNYAYVNGRFVPEAEATISIFDRGFLYGDGVFETMRVYDGKIFRLKQHVHRLLEGVVHLRMRAPFTEEWITATFDDLIARNEVRDGVARIYVTRGASAVGLSAPTDLSQSIVVQAWSRSFPSESTGFRVTSIPHAYATHGLLWRFKTANRLPYVLAKLEAEQAGKDDALLLKGQNAAELTASNLFAVKNGELMTPFHCFPGITREIVLSLAKGIGIATRETTLSLHTVEDSDELFATNSLIEITPIVGLNKIVYHQNPVTQRLREAYRGSVREELGLR
jgi:branched-chain amino acid aminotransferase